MTHHSRILFLFLFVLFAPVLTAQIIYVNQFASGNNTGTDWANAFTDLQSALAIAQAGEEIWVAAGTYLPTDELDQYATFSIPTGVGLYGGFAGHEEERDQRDWEHHIAILDGNTAEHTSADNSYSVVTITDPDSLTALDGFTITNGIAIILDTSVPTYDAARRGGGVLIRTTGTNQMYPLTIRNCIFFKNEAEYGGAIYGDARNGNHLGLLVQGCSFRTNGAGHGAVYAGEGGNTGGTIQFKDCRFEDNEARTYGLIHIRANGGKSGRLEIINCEFSNNRRTLVDVLNYFDEVPFDLHFQDTKVLDTDLSETTLPLFNYRSYSNSSLYLEDVLFKDNIGAGSILELFALQMVEMRQVQFTGNQFQQLMYGEPQKILIDSCTFMDNSVENNMVIVNADTVIVRHSNFERNTAASTIWSGTGADFSEWKNCRLYSNVARNLLSLNADTLLADRLYIWDGKGESAGRITFNGQYSRISNSLFARPSHSEIKYALTTDWPDNRIELANCTFYNYHNAYNGALFTANISESRGGPASITMHNSIIWNTSAAYAPPFALHRAHVEISHSLLKATDCNTLFSYAELPADENNTSLTCGEGMIFGLEPEFVRPELGDFMLNPCSPAVDQGAIIYLSEDTVQDLANQTRLYGDRIDIGAYELQSPAGQLEVEADVIPATSSEAMDGSITLTSVTGGAPGYTYLWDIGETGNSISGLREGVYSVIISDEAGCSQTFIFEVSSPNATVDPLSAWNARLWPNPAQKNEVGHLSFPADLGLTGVRIYNLHRQLLWEQQLTGVEGVDLPVPAVSGIYLLQLTDRSGRQGYLKWVVD